jgi:4a-hydroxytetrahydrobiopterin dehydratase
MPDKLETQKCQPCSGDTPPLQGEKLIAFKDEIDPGWEVIEGHHLEREFKFDDFNQALDFVNKVGEIAEEEQHHPDLFLSWGKVGIKLWTHAIDGLSENDFIVAAKVDQLT